MIEKKTKFICDCCNKEKETESNTGFVYDAGWKYIYALNIKTNNERIRISDKHFCSNKCLIKFITDQLKAKEKKDA